MQTVQNTAYADPEVQLMLQFKAGNDQAFEELYGRIRLPVYRFAYRIMGEAQAAEEAAQDIMVKVYRSREKYQATARFRTWLFRVATNHCLNEKRRAWRQREVGVEVGTAGLDAPATLSTNPSLVAEGMELAAAVQIAVGNLPERQRVAVVLARYEGCTMKEIGDVLGVADGAVKALLNRARKSLTQQLEPFMKTENE